MNEIIVFVWICYVLLKMEAMKNVRSEHVLT